MQISDTSAAAKKMTLTLSGQSGQKRLKNNHLASLV